MFSVSVFHFVWDNAYGNENVALNRTTFQSSQFNRDGPSHNVVDGNPDG